MRILCPETAIKSAGAFHRLSLTRIGAKPLVSATIDCLEDRRGHVASVPDGLRNDGLGGLTIGVTGVAGFIGSHVARRCLEIGCRVKGLDQTPWSPADANFEMTVGDINDHATVRRFCEEVDVVIHTAAIVREGGRRADFQRVNVEGTRVVVESSAACGVQKLVHVSSVMVYGFNYPHAVDEDGPLEGHGNPYCETKIASEQIALQNATPEMDVIVLRCGDVYGPGSLPWTVRPIKLMKKRDFLLVNGGRGVINYVYIDNLVEGVLLATEKAPSGSVFNFTDGVATCREFFGYYSTMIGKRPLRSVPGWMFRPVTYFHRYLRRHSDPDMVVHPDVTPFLMRPHGYSSQKARSVLGYSPTVTLEDGMRRIESWAIESGLIRRRIA